MCLGCLEATALPLAHSCARSDSVTSRYPPMTDPRIGLTAEKRSRMKQLVSTTRRVGLRGIHELSGDEAVDRRPKRGVAVVVRQVWRAWHHTVDNASSTCLGISNPGPCSAVTLTSGA